MQLCNESITLFNARFDREKDATVYVPTILSGVHTKVDIKSSVDKNGLNAADSFTVRIPLNVDAEGKEYADPQTYASADTDSYFTLNQGDIIVIGVVNTKYTMSNAQLKKLPLKTILGVSDNSNAPKAPHWKVVGS